MGSLLLSFFYIRYTPAPTAFRSQNVSKNSKREVLGVVIDEKSLDFVEIELGGGQKVKEG